VIGSNVKCYSVLQQIQDWLRDKIQDWLLDKFLEKTRASKMAATLVRTLVSFDGMFIIKLILSKYGLGYLMNYVLLLSMM
jgi:hypothetical protein